MAPRVDHYHRMSSTRVRLHGPALQVSSLFITTVPTSISMTLRRRSTARSPVVPLRVEDDTSATSCILNVISLSVANYPATVFPSEITVSGNLGSRRYGERARRCVTSIPARARSNKARKQATLPDTRRSKQSKVRRDRQRTSQGIRSPSIPSRTEVKRVAP